MSGMTKKESFVFGQFIDLKDYVEKSCYSEKEKAAYLIETMIKCYDQGFNEARKNINQKLDYFKTEHGNE